MLDLSVRPDSMQPQDRNSSVCSTGTGAISSADWTVNGWSAAKVLGRSVCVDRKSGSGRISELCERQLDRCLRVSSWRQRLRVCGRD